MRLIRLGSRSDLSDLTLQEFVGDYVPPYAIISHTWGTDEVSLSDIINHTGREKDGFGKIRFCSEQAIQDGLAYIWFDTCCIDKASSAELSEAINSMFRWYRNAAKCYVFLQDVSISNADDGSHEWKSQLSTCRWFTRGWTLQELLAPTTLRFFSKEGIFLGSKESLEDDLHSLTGVPVEALRGHPLSSFGIEERFLWAAHRRTTRVEDEAYCLLGIFDVSMPLIYGEGLARAFVRLRREIQERTTYELPAYNELLHSPAFHPVKEQLVLALHTQHDLETLCGSENDESPEVDERMNPTPGTREQIYNHVLENNRFRLFNLDPGVIGSQITGCLQEFSVLEAPAFHALSYVWGHEPAVHRMTVNGQAVFVRPNLFHALQRVRLRSGNLRVWIDSLCINQEADAERNAQVSEMSNIYGNAEGVLIWLGEEDATSKLALELVAQINSRDYTWGTAWWEEYGFLALGNLLDRPWFRRGWVLQEAAFSTNSTIQCGDMQIHMDHFTRAVDLIRARMSDAPIWLHSRDTTRTNPLANFQDSPAIRLLDTIQGVFQKSTNGRILHRRMTLESLVYFGRCNETTDHRDAIYSLLNLANDVDSRAMEEASPPIIPDYGKSVLDVFADFIIHCCHRSRSLDIICHPWAPVSLDSQSVTGPLQQSPYELSRFPSWIATKDKLPFGNPSWNLKQRLHGSPLVGMTQQRIYNAHGDTKPCIEVGRVVDTGETDGSLIAKGMIIGTIAQTSTRLADAIITKECLETLGTITRRSHSDVIHLPDAIWRTLCADRDDNGQHASFNYRMAMLYLLEMNLKAPSDTEDPTDVLDKMSSIDIEELLETDIPGYVKAYLKVVRDIIWNRRAFRTEGSDDEGAIVGLAPRNAVAGDKVCILYGCSVPVVLRCLESNDGHVYWRLIGDAYAHGVMDGERFRFSSQQMLESTGVDFEIK